MTIETDREDTVLLEFNKFLLQSSITTVLLEQPDRLPPAKRQFPELTTDDLMKFSRSNVGGVAGPSTDLIAGVDVMILAQDRENLALHDLDESILAIAHALGLQVTLLPSPPIFRSECEEIVQRLKSAIENDTTTGTFEYRAGVRFSWREVRTGESPNFIVIGTWLHTPSAKISDQIRNENAVPLTRKTKSGGQAERCQQSGLPYILLLDGIGTDAVVQGTHWMSDAPFTFQEGILEALGERGQLVNAIFMVGKNGEWSVLKNDLEVFSAVPTGI